MTPEKSEVIRAKEIAATVGLQVTEYQGTYAIYPNGISAHRIGTDTSLFRGSIQEVLHYLDRAAKGTPLEGCRPNRWTSEVSPQTAIWHEGRDEAVAMGKVIAEWEEDESTLYVATEGFLSVGMDTYVEVSWLSVTGDVRATSYVKDDFLPIVLRSNNGRGPNEGDKLQIHRRYTPANHEQKQNITITVELS